MPSYTVRLDLPLIHRPGSRTAAAVARLDDRLAGWHQRGISGAQLESLILRGQRASKARIVVGSIPTGGSQLAGPVPVTGTGPSWRVSD